MGTLTSAAFTKSLAAQNEPPTDWTEEKSVDVSRIPNFLGSNTLGHILDWTQLLSIFYLNKLWAEYRHNFHRFLSRSGSKTKPHGKETDHERLDEELAGTGCGIV